VSVRRLILGPCRCQGCGRLVYWARPVIDFYGASMLGRARWVVADGSEHLC
jgi:hypothetical protein